MVITFQPGTGSEQAAGELGGLGFGVFFGNSRVEISEMGSLENNVSLKRNTRCVLSSGAAFAHEVNEQVVGGGGSTCVVHVCFA